MAKGVTEIFARHVTAGAPFSRRRTHKATSPTAGHSALMHAASCYLGLQATCDNSQYRRVKGNGIGIYLDKFGIKSGRAIGARTKNRIAIEIVYWHKRPYRRRNYKMIAAGYRGNAWRSRYPCRLALVAQFALTAHQIINKGEKHPSDKVDRTANATAQPLHDTPMSSAGHYYQ
ncbi:hypothetical protein EVAR_90331_1 [Eumeta japonica]|uniref:Uncharacterized protein n=1 Tax=Eumeta variegata TaxID=151549 RepID=A0A4C1YK02_EUMVA|nr:hypothetical protein EVAR_90331_1 [Eumeta japonica]